MPTGSLATNKADSSRRARCVSAGALAALLLAAAPVQAQPTPGCWLVIDGQAVLRPGKNGVHHMYMTYDNHKPGHFYFKQTGADTFLLYDLDRSYMVNGVHAKTWVTAQPGVNPASDKDWPEWRITKRADSSTYDLRSTKTGYYLRIGSRTFAEAAEAPPATGFTLTRAGDGDCRVPPEPEIQTDARAPRFERGAPIVGIADVHSHAFANEGFGGLALQGKPFHAWGMAGALAWCDWAFGLLAHGDRGLGDIIGNLMDGRTAGHPVGGAHKFDGWPLWYATTHQQMYYRWLERAHRGGLRLQVLLAVNNEMLCRVSNNAPGYDCDDMNAIDRQVDKAKELERFIDAENGGTGKGWLRIVYSPAEARRAIEAGKLAIVLGIEVDGLFGCKVDCTEERIKLLLQLYFDKGIRYAFPVHVFDNAFGGAALINPLFNMGNHAVTGSFFKVRDCSAEGYEHDTNLTPSPIAEVLHFVGRQMGWPLPPKYPGKAHCNERRLSSYGRLLINEMMNRKMIIDVDHMSASTLDDVLEMAEAPERRYPVIAGHTGFIEVSIKQKKSEGQKSAAQVERIRKLGGLVAPILHQGSVAEIKPWGTDVQMDCDESSKSWAQAYLYAVDKMGADSAVPLGSDLNGWIRMPAPRFAAGTDESGRPCNRNRPQLRHQKNPIAYPFRLPAVAGVDGQFNRMTSGGRIYDYNSDGFANVGMLPDFVKDLEQVGVSPAKLAPLFRSAEGFIKMWERIDPGTERTRGSRTDRGATALRDSKDAER
jgi:microsomal dipeptidase-like Zn-dependent dipeptidase